MAYTELQKAVIDQMDIADYGDAEIKEIMTIISETGDDVVQGFIYHDDFTGFAIKNMPIILPALVYMGNERSSCLLKMITKLPIMKEEKIGPWPVAQFLLGHLDSGHYAYLTTARIVSLLILGHVAYQISEDI